MRNNSNNTYLSQIIKRTISLAKLEMEYQNMNGKLSLRSNILDNLPFSVFVHDIEGNIWYANRMALKLIKIPEEKIFNYNFYSMDLKSNPGLHEKRINELLSEGTIEFTIDIYSEKDSKVKLNVEEKLMEIKNEKLVLSMVNNLKELNNEKTEFNPQLNQKSSSEIGAIGEDSVLTQNENRVIVKDNLDLISSLINLQSRYSKDDETYKVFREIQNRVRAITFAQEKYRYSNETSGVYLPDYVRGLTRRLLDSYKTLIKKIDLKLEISNIYLNMDILIPCGLIINELVTNSVKYAFPDEKGEIKVIFCENDDTYSLIVADNGIGLSADFNLNNIDTLGLQLVNNLTKQINGKIKIDKKIGTSFNITFPKTV
ncbi:MAG: histidine kinase dimerization/phosphoacceptor domain -containing protein [Methanomicrobiales archaeon]